MTKIFKNPWVKLAAATILTAVIIFVLRLLRRDFSKITTQDFKDKIDSLGIWGPITYIIFYILRPLIFFPAAILSASAGVIWGLKGFIYLQIAANISSAAEFFIARYFARGAFERAIRRSLPRIRPRSPCPASAGWRKIEGVPVLAKVAEIFCPMMPALPIPASTTSPSQPRSRSTAREKDASSLSWRFERVRASVAITSRAAVILGSFIWLNSGSAS